MRRSIMRATRLIIIISSIVLAIPFNGIVWWLSTRPDLVMAWLDRSPAQRALDLLLATLAFVLCGAVTAYLVGRAEFARLIGPVQQITEQAEQLGRGEATKEPTTSGIDEIDRVSRVLTRAGYEQQRRLASERSFASDASHQLRTPLTALLMRIEEIAATDDLQVVKQEATAAIAQVERLTGVVDDLLHRRRAEPAGQTLTSSLDSVLAALQKEWQPAFETARRSIRVHGARGLQVRATPVTLSEVLSTLLENSLVHGRGTVEVLVRRSGPSVVVEVRDAGDGIPSTLAPRVFERSVSGAGGTGVGLAVARDLAESFGGRLDLIARVPATFALFLSEADPEPPTSRR